MVEDTRTYTRAELEEVAGMCAGAAAGVFMRKHPHDVMPSEEISRAMGLVLADFDERRSSRSLEEVQAEHHDELVESHGELGATVQEGLERKQRGETRHISTVTGAGDAETIAKRTALADRLAERLEGDDG